MVTAKGKIHISFDARRDVGEKRGKVLPICMLEVLPSVVDARRISWTITRGKVNAQWQMIRYKRKIRGRRNVRNERGIR